MSGLVTLSGFLWNYTKKIEEMSKTMNQNRCDILLETLSSKQVDLSYKKSSDRASKYADDAMDYHFRVLKETQSLVNEIEEIKSERSRLGC
jgi:uncharacterized protein YpbB